MQKRTRQKLIKVGAEHPELRSNIERILDYDKQAEEEEKVPEISGAGNVMDGVFMELGDSIEDVTEEDPDKVEDVESAAGGGIGIGLIASVVLSLPKVSMIVGKGVDKIGKFLKKKFQGREVSSAGLGKFLAELGEKLEDKYVGIIQKALWGISKTPIINKKFNLKDMDNKDLHKVSKTIFYAILLVAAGNAFSTAYAHMGSIMSAIEGALGGVKTEEIMEAVKEIT